MRFFRVLTAIMAIMASDVAYAEAEDALEGREVITTTRTVERLDDEGNLEPVEKETKTETIDIPVNEEESAPKTVPCENNAQYFEEEFIENNEDDDSDIAAETGVLPDILMKENPLEHTQGYELNDVPPEMLEEEPINPDELEIEKPVKQSYPDLELKGSI